MWHKFTSFLIKHEWSIFFLILLVSFVLKFFNLSYPQDYMFDEVYHVPTAHLIVQNDPSAFEWWHGELTNEITTGAYIDWLHPPLAKYLTALSIIILGDTSFAWRLPSALCGTLITFLVFYLAKILFPKKPLISLIAAFLIAIEGLVLAQSRIVMNDIVVVAFMLLALIFYLKYKKSNKFSHQLWCILFTGLAIGTKWSAIFLWLIYFVNEIYNLVVNKKNKNHHHNLKNSFFFLLNIFSGSVILYFVVYTMLFTTGHNLAHFFELHNQIWLYQTGLEATHPYSAPAYLWPIGQKAIYHYLDPITNKQIWATPSLWIFILGLVSFIYSCFYYLKTFKQKKSVVVCKSLFFLISCYLIVWLPWVFSPRIMFIYHYLPAVPILCILIGFTLDKVMTRISHKFGL